MRVVKIFSSIAAFLFLCTVAMAQQKSTGRWYKGNLHTHSYWSDGDQFPEMIMDWYKSHGYDFIALSDHNVLAEGEKWKTLPKGKIYAMGFEKYKEKYGDKWVVYRTDSAGLHVKLKTLAEYRPLFEDEHFLIIRSEEITDKFEDKHIHLNATNIQTLIQPQGGNSVRDVLQRNIDAVLKQRKETGVPLIPHINHPNFFYSISTEDMIALKGERFFEVYNGHPMVHNYGDSLHPGTEAMWDKINMAYAKRNQPLLYGLATDDSHNYHIMGGDQSNSGRGWIVVRADSLTPASLIQSMEAGQFYASTGVVLNDVTIKKGTLIVDIKTDPGIHYEIQFIGAKKGDETSRIISKTTGTKATFKITNEFLFVRAKIISDKIKVNPFQEGEFETAWTQPVGQ